MENRTKNSNQICNNSGDSQSLWMDICLPSFPPLNSNLMTDVCIVGTGIVGLTCAYTLAKKGQSVILVDQGCTAGGQTARTTAHLTWVLDERYHRLENLFGEERAQLALESHSYAIDYIEKIIREENIDCDFERVNGYLFVPPGESKDILDKEFFVLKKMGKEVFKDQKAPLNPSFDIGECLCFPEQAQFHILKYVQGLIKAILKYGGKIFNSTHVNHIEEDGECTVTTKSTFKITAHSVIIATCSPINNRFYIHTKQAPYRTYVIATAIPHNSVSKALYWDTADPYHYMRIQKHSEDPSLDWLIVGGEDHKTGQDCHVQEKYDNLENWTKKRFPFIEKIQYRWSGQVFEPTDSLAFIGKNPGNKHIYISTGDCGNGMTHGTIAGILIPDLIFGINHPWEKLYDPSRKNLFALSEFIKENLNVAAQYLDWLTPGETKKINLLSPNEGIIIREGLEKIAVYRDQQDQLHFNSAFCPHLGACVRWNPGEKSWDCPCHGSRFNGCGEVITGPAINGLFSHNLSSDKNKI